LNSATIATGFGVAAGVFAVFFFGELPRVRNDILRKLPFLDTYFDRTLPAEDNVRLSLSVMSVMSVVD
jgi:Ubiquinol-cytochrome-c reductase complex subunit (QCR10)